MSNITITIIYDEMETRVFNNASKARKFVKTLDANYRVLVLHNGRHKKFKNIKKAIKYVEELEESSSEEESSSDEEEEVRPRRTPGKNNTNKITKLPAAIFGKDAKKAEKAATETIPYLTRNQNVMREQCNLAIARCRAYTRKGIAYEPVPRKMTLERLEVAVEISLLQGKDTRRKANGNARLIKNK